MVSCKNPWYRHHWNEVTMGTYWLKIVKSEDQIGEIDKFALWK